MNSDETSVQFFQNQTSISAIPSMVERWCMDSEPIEGDIAEVYAINFASSPVSTKSVLKTDQITAVGHQKKLEDRLQVFG
jgi:hypothetical protein